MSYRSSSPPISGFSGHIPGRKWQVGKHQNNPNQSNMINNRPELNEPLQIRMMENNTYDPQQMAQLYQQQMAQMQASGQMPMMPFYGFNPYMMNGFNPSASMHGLNQISSTTGNHLSPQGQTKGTVANDNRNQSRPDSSSTKNRSKSVPRKVNSDVKDIFGGIESGWWSEGQALKNLRRHQQLVNERGTNIEGNDNNTTMSSIKSRSRRNIDFNDESDVPTPGYSGHVPGIKQYGIGKPFTVAAKECRRKMHSNDSTQISSSSANSAAIKAKNKSSDNSLNSTQHSIQVPSVNGYYPNSTQNPFMQSYPYGMMPPMFMNSFQQMPMPQPPSEYNHET